MQIEIEMERWRWLRLGVMELLRRREGAKVAVRQSRRITKLSNAFSRAFFLFALPPALVPSRDAPRDLVAPLSTANASVTLNCLATAPT